MTAREKIYLELHGTSLPGLTMTQRVLAFAIVASVALAVAGTEPDLGHDALEFIEAAEFGFGALVLAEYVLRVWLHP